VKGSTSTGSIPGRPARVADRSHSDNAVTGGNTPRADHRDNAQTAENASPSPQFVGSGPNTGPRHLDNTRIPRLGPPRARTPPEPDRCRTVLATLPLARMTLGPAKGDQGIPDRPSRHPYNARTLRFLPDGRLLAQRVSSLR
jgi:hypothetical protein